MGSILKRQTGRYFMYMTYTTTRTQAGQVINIVPHVTVFMISTLQKPDHLLWMWMWALSELLSLQDDIWCLDSFFLPITEALTPRCSWTYFNAGSLVPRTSHCHTSIGRTNGNMSELRAQLSGHKNPKGGEFQLVPSKWPNAIKIEKLPQRCMSENTVRLIVAEAACLPLSKGRGKRGLCGEKLQAINQTRKHGTRWALIWSSKMNIMTHSQPIGPSPKWQHSWNGIPEQGFGSRIDCARNAWHTEILSSGFHIIQLCPGLPIFEYGASDF